LLVVQHAEGSFTLEHEVEVRLTDHHLVEHLDFDVSDLVQDEIGRNCIDLLDAIFVAWSLH
jgi:hypothetical protein